MIKKMSNLVLTRELDKVKNICAVSPYNMHVFTQLLSHWQDVTQGQCKTEKVDLN